MRPSDKTSMGGAKSRFQTTHWSEIRNARTRNDTRRRIIINGLIGTYWKPVYGCLRQKGYDNEQAKDLTQGFFHEIILGKSLIQQADEDKGRFRTFLLRALDNYVTSIHRANMAEKRHPRDGIISLDEFEEVSMSWAAPDMKPEDAFTYLWASTIMDDILAEVREGCFRDGKAIHWELFRARILDPIMTGTKPQSVSELCEQFGIDNKDKVSNMIVTVKRRFQVAMSHRIRQHVDSDEEAEQEIRDLMQILSKNSAS